LKTVVFQYRTELAFLSPASEHRFRLKILPQSDDRQTVQTLTWQIDPPGRVWPVCDGFGNDVLSGTVEGPHSHFHFGVTGEARVSDTPYTACDRPEPVLAYPSELTQPHGGLAGFHRDLAKDAPEGVFPRAAYFAQAVHTHLRYQRGATGAWTPAREAFDIGAGVCQDFSHILLTLLRLDRIPCRYVAGLASDYGETHAWAEAWAEGRWFGIDPTRNKPIDGGYLALSRGRDFHDCSVERGVYKGLDRGVQTISLTMEVNP